MLYCQDRMLDQHPGSRVLHHFPDFSPSINLIAMNFAIAALRLDFMRAFLESLPCVLKEFLALLTKTLLGLVMSPAEDFDHFADCSGLDFCFILHDTLCLASCSLL
jgi:hypothetical protein